MEIQGLVADLARFAMSGERLRSLPLFAGTNYCMTGSRELAPLIDSARAPSRHSFMQPLDIQPPLDIRRKGRAWRIDEWRLRWELTPEKFEVYRGKLFFSQQERIKLLALLLENVGADTAVRLGDPLVWRAAIAALESQPPNAQ